MRIRSEWKLRSYLSRVRIVWTGCAGTKSSSLSGARAWSSNLFCKAPSETQGVSDGGSHFRTSGGATSGVAGKGVVVHTLARAFCVRSECGCGCAEAG